MKTFILALICILLSTKVYSQKTSYIGKLELISGKIETYYVYGYQEQAEYLQIVIEDAVDFYENLLNDTLSFDLFVLDRKNWRQNTRIPYPLPHYLNSDERIIMPVKSFCKIQLPEVDSIYGKNYFYFSDFIAIHELGHYISRKQGARSYIQWSGEFFADYIQIAYMHEIIPRFKFTNKAAKLFPFIPLKYKTLEKFGSAGIINGLFYHSKFQELADQIFLKDGFNFMFDYLQIYKQLNKEINDGKYETVTVTNEMIFQNSIENILSIEPDIFTEWNRSMRHTFHSWIFLFGLVLLIGIIRLTDTSCSIFNNLNLKTKRIHKIFGIPTIRILNNLKHITSRSLRIRLIRISVSRIINCFLVLALFLLLVILLW